MAQTLASARLLWTCVVAALGLFAATTVGLLVEWGLKSANPDDVDVTQGLAYLRPILVTTLGLVVVAIVATVALIVRLGKAEGAGATKLPWVLFAAQAVLWLVFVVTRASLGSIIQP